MLDTFRTHKLETGSFCTKIGYGFFFMLVTRDVVTEVSFHIFEGECFMHGTEVFILNNKQLTILNKPLLKDKLTN